MSYLPCIYGRVTRLISRISYNSPNYLISSPLFHLFRIMSNHISFNPISAALNDGDDDDDWQHLTHEDVGDIHQLFDFFVAQDGAMQKIHRPDVDIEVDTQTGEAKLVEQDQATKSRTQPLLTIKGMDRLLRSMGLFVPIRDLQRVFNEWKLHLGTGPRNARRGDKLPSVRGFTYEDFLYFYATTTKNLSSDKELKAAFQLLDDDDDGFVLVSKMIPLICNLMEISVEEAQNSLLLARSDYPEKNAQFPPRTHSLLEKNFAFSRMNDEQWLAEGSLSFDEFVEFLNT